MGLRHWITWINVGLERRVRKAERCLQVGCRYMAHTINASRTAPYEEYRDCGNFTWKVK
jgi:hypothetical protein